MSHANCYSEVFYIAVEIWLYILMWK